MSHRVCIICLVNESSTRLFSMYAAQSEDYKRYEVLTGVKLKSVAYICQRCSIDLGIAYNLRQKALESFKCLQPSLPTLNSTNLQDINKNSRAQRISSQVVDPPLSSIDINNIFKSKPNLTVITRTKKVQTGTKLNLNQSINDQQVTTNTSSNVMKAPLNSTTQFQRRKSVCVPKSSTIIHIGGFEGTAKPLINVKKDILKDNPNTGNTTNACKKQSNTNNKIGQLSSKTVTLGPSDSKKFMKRPFPNDDDDTIEIEISDSESPKKSKTTIAASKSAENFKSPKAHEPESELKYCFCSPNGGYRIETFKTIKDAEAYIKEISKETTFDRI